MTEADLPSSPGRPLDGRAPDLHDRQDSPGADHGLIPGPPPTASPPSYVPDAGYYVERAGRDGLRYHEGGRSVLIFAEMLVPKGFAIYTDSIKRWDPPDKSKISKQERKRIVENVRLALASQGQVADID
ncbi:MAG TPA: Imm74 family immunity protein [Candidatus Dormibacteraeota bacterium]|nr:Imm74 family immunity protein [Candidatus Dormibacteraeota bacterium]